MTPSNHPLSNGDVLWAQTFRGVVVASSETSETVVRQDERLQKVGGSLVWTPGAIQSDVVRTHKIWLQGSDGRERDIDLSAVPLALREGHDITIMWIGKQGVEAGLLAAAINHTTKKRYVADLNKADFVRAYKALKLKNPSVVQWWVGGAAVLLVIAFKGIGHFFAGLVVRLFAAIGAELFLMVVARVTGLAVGQYGRGTHLLAQVQRTLETQVQCIEAAGQPV